MLVDHFSKFKGIFFIGKPTRYRLDTENGATLQELQEK